MNRGGFNPRASIVFPVEVYKYLRYSVGQVLSLKNLTTHLQYRVEILQKYDVVNFQRIKQEHPMNNLVVPSLPLAVFDHAFLLYVIETFRV